MFGKDPKAAARTGGAVPHSLLLSLAYEWLRYVFPIPVPILAPEPGMSFDYSSAPRRQQPAQLCSHRPEPGSPRHGAGQRGLWLPACAMPCATAHPACPAAPPPLVTCP